MGLSAARAGAVASQPQDAETSQTTELDERGSLVLDDELRTSNKKVLAAGDVTGAPQFV